MAGVTPHWSTVWIAVVCAFFGATAIGWNGVYLALLARIAPVGAAGATTGAALAVTYGGVLFGPPAFALLTESETGYAASFVIVGAAAVLCGLWLLVRGWRE